MANKQKPTNIHLLTGTHRKDRHGDPEQKVEIKEQIKTAPDWLPDEAKVEWKRICKALKESGVLTEVDSTILAQYCLLYSELAVERTEFSAAKHTQLRMCMTEMGLTPSSRGKIVVGSKKKGNAFDDI